MTLPRYDVAVIGGGIVGLATAMALTTRARATLLLLETEDHLAAHQTGNNSGVIHSGLYYKPGSLRARNCVRGRELLYRFCQEHGVVHERCGKLVVATRPEELPALDELERRGLANGLTGLRRLRPEELRDYEPHVSGCAGLLVPETGIVDYKQVAEKFAGLIRRAGGTIETSRRFLRCTRAADGLVLATTGGDVCCRALINCGGLHADRVARACGVEPGLQIVPFRGEYYQLTPERRFLVKNLIYPVPDPLFPFLGVHFTRMVRGGVEAGPNAVLALKREGYRHRDISLTDVVQMAAYGGFRRLIARNWKTGLGELYRSLNKSAFCKALQRLIPEVRKEDLIPAGAGVRAQAVDPSGAIVDDFRMVPADRMIHVLNAPSPAATASISIGETIAEMAIKDFGLALRR